MLKFLIDEGFEYDIVILLECNNVKCREYIRETFNIVFPGDNIIIKLKHKLKYKKDAFTINFLLFLIYKCYKIIIKYIKDFYYRYIFKLF